MAKYDRDYVTTLPLLEEKANEYSDGAWNKYDNDIGETLIKFLACTSHTIDYYFRKYLNSLLLPNNDWNTKSLVWELTGYKPPYIRADYMMVQLYWPDCGLLTYVPLYMYTPFNVVADGVEYTFLCAEDYLIPPMTTRLNVKLVQGTLNRIDQDYTKIRDNKIKLCDEDIDFDLVTLTVSGVKWTQVRNIYYSPETERIFSLHQEEDGIYLYLHKTWESYIDEYDPSFTIDFIISDQSFDDVTEDCISISIGTELLDTNGVDVSQFYHVYPMPSADTGEEVQPSTVEGERVITTDDYTSKAELYPGVATARAFSWDTFNVTRKPFEVKIVASGYNGALRNRTKEALISYLKSVGSKLIDVQIIDPVYVPQSLTVLMDIGDYLGTLIEVQIRLLIQQALEDFYKIGNIPPGYEVTTKELNSLLLHVDQRMIYVETSINNYWAHGPRIIPVLGNLRIITEATVMPKYDVGHVSEVIKVYNAIFVFDSGSAEDKGGVYTVKQGLREELLAHTIIPIDKDLVLGKDNTVFVENLHFLRKEFSIKEHFESSQILSTEKGIFTEHPLISSDITVQGGSLVTNVDFHSLLSSSDVYVDSDNLIISAEEV